MGSTQRGSEESRIGQMEKLNCDALTTKASADPTESFGIVLNCCGKESSHYTNICFLSHKHT